MSQLHRRLLNYAVPREIRPRSMVPGRCAKNPVGMTFANKPIGTELAVGRFRNTDRIMVQLEHLSIACVEEVCKQVPSLTVSMEYFAGHDLNQYAHQWGAMC